MSLLDPQSLALTLPTPSSVFPVSPVSPKSIHFYGLKPLIRKTSESPSSGATKETETLSTVASLHTNVWSAVICGLLAVIFSFSS